ncbi:MAG: hypothetical protein M1812_000199 [Candelaria pacifica]|nr:MAG: hypothetical protein M1812_000199 [Candelaria pacifica]
MLRNRVVFSGRTNWPSVLGGADPAGAAAEDEEVPNEEDTVDTEGEEDTEDEEDAEDEEDTEDKEDTDTEEDEIEVVTVGLRDELGKVLLLDGIVEVVLSIVPGVDEPIKLLDVVIMTGLGGEPPNAAEELEEIDVLGMLVNVVMDVIILSVELDKDDKEDVDKDEILELTELLEIELLDIVVTTGEPSEHPFWHPLATRQCPGVAPHYNYD